MFRSSKDITYMGPLKTSQKSLRSDIIYYSCDICDEEYMSESEVEVHRRKEHRIDLEKLMANKRKYVCKICIKEVPDEQSLISHTKMQHLLSSATAERVEREIFVCDTCHQIFFNKQLLVIHILHTHDIKPKDKPNKIVECPRCSKKVKLQAIWYHYQQHEIQSVACCPICLEKCKNRTCLQEHIKSHPLHLICDICGYEGKKYPFYKEHLRKHSPVGTMYYTVNRRYKSFYIPKQSALNSTLPSQFGLRGMCNLNGLHICILCREICENTVDMKSHLGIAHRSEERPKTRYVCVCGEEFFNNILLKQHLFKLKEGHRALQNYELPGKSESGFPQYVLKNETL